MRYRTQECGLDRLTTPIIMCDPDGFVIYKNDIAVKEIRLPKRNTDMKTHLNERDRDSLKEIFTRPAVISVYTGDRIAKAFVSAHQRDGKDCTLWMFPAFLQVSPTSAFFSALNKELEKLGADFSAIIKSLEQKELTSSERSKNALQKRIGEKLDRMLEETFATRNERANWSVEECLDILKNQLGSLFKEQGYLIDCNFDVAREHLRKYLNLRDFLAFYSHALTFCCELTRNRRVALDVKSQEGKDLIDFRILFTMMFPPVYTDGQEDRESDICKLIPYFPDHHVEIKMFEKLVKYGGYEVEYTISEKHRDNVEFLFRIPLTANRGFSAPRTQGWESLLLANDCDNYVRCLLLLSNFIAALAEESDQ